MSDEDLYVQATNELHHGNYSTALWTKALNLCRGDEQEAFYKYVDLRVEQLQPQSVTEENVVQSVVEMDPEVGKSYSDYRRTEDRYYQNNDEINEQKLEEDHYKRETNNEHTTHEDQQSDSRHKSYMGPERTLLRQILGGICIAGGLVFIVGLIYILTSGDSLPPLALLVVVVLFSLAAYELLRCGYLEITSKGYARAATAWLGGLLFVGVLVRFYKYLNENNLSLGAVLTVETPISIYLPDLSILLIGMVSFYLGYTGWKHERVTEVRSPATERLKSSPTATDYFLGIVGLIIGIFILLVGFGTYQTDQSAAIFVWVLGGWIAWLGILNFKH